MNCPKCSTPIKEGVKFCNKCGSPLYSPSVSPTTADVNKPVCTKCGNQVNSGSKFCANCGGEICSTSDHDKSDTSRATAEILQTPESPKKDRPDDTISQSDKPEKAPTPQVSPRQKTKLWMPICAALVFVLGVGGIIILQNRNSIRTMSPSVVQSNSGADIGSSRTASEAGNAISDTSPRLPAPPPETQPVLSPEQEYNYSAYSPNELIVTTAMYEHYKSYIAAINDEDINKIKGVTPDYLGILKRQGITGENSYYDFNFYEMRINMDTINFNSSQNSVSFDANCLFEYKKRGSTEAWVQGTNVLFCQMIYDKRSDSWFVNSTFEQKEKEDQVFGVDTPNKNLLIINDGNYYDMFDYIFSTEYEINDISPFLRDYYWNYLEAINEQDPSYLAFATPEQEERLIERIFDVNSDNIFTFNQIIIDLDTVSFYESNGHTNVSFYAAFTFSYVDRRGSSRVNHGANIQHVNMICDEAQQEWIVDFSEIVLGIDIGSNQLIVQ